MPILHIRALKQLDSSIVEDALRVTCVAIAKVYGCALNQVWATWEEIQSGYYVEGDQSADSQPRKTHPPIMELICFEGKTTEQIEELLKVTSKTLSDALKISENILSLTMRQNQDK